MLTFCITVILSILGTIFAKPMVNIGIPAMVEVLGRYQSGKWKLIKLKNEAK